MVPMILGKEYVGEGYIGVRAGAVVEGWCPLGQEEQNMNECLLPRRSHCHIAFVTTTRCRYQTDKNLHNIVADIASAKKYVSS